MGILSDPRRYLWQWELDAPPASLWPLVANTDRFNRDTGLPPVEDLRDGHELAPGRRRLRILVDATGWRAHAATSAEVLVLQDETGGL